MNQALITFPAGEVLIDLIDTPGVTLWKQALQDYNSNNLPLYTQVGKLLSRGSKSYKDRDIEFEETCVNEINSSIDQFNLLTTGKKFNYRAYVDMPWSQTNLIHRCFTLGLSSINPVNKDTYGGLLKHNMTVKQLLKFKQRYVYDEKRKFLDFTPIQYYFEAKHKEKVSAALHKINKWVHLYENKRHSQAVADFHEHWITQAEMDASVHHPTQINLGWDVFTSTGDKTYNNPIDIPSYIVKDSIPDNWMDYDVFAIKSITGKDYETCYQNFDDPREYDIQNIQAINGGVRIFPSQGHKAVYADNALGGWVKDYGLETHQYAPMPIGKIIKSDFNLNHIKMDRGKTNTNGAIAAMPLYANPKITLI